MVRARLAVFGMLGAVLVGCGGVSAEEHRAVVDERDALKEQVAKLRDDLDRAKAAASEKAKDAKPAKAARPAEAAVANALAQLKVEAGGKLFADLKTSLGDIHCQLWPEIAPETVLNFVGLSEGTREWTQPGTTAKVKKPLYPGTKFHRVIQGFMIQGGDPLGNGTGGPGYRFGDEVWPDVRFDRPGLLAMANAGPGTNGSQFFITQGKPPTHLNGKHTIFGECDLDTVVKIASVQVGANDKPVKDVVLEKVSVSRQPSTAANQGTPPAGVGGPPPGAPPAAAGAPPAAPPAAPKP
jgi:peptidyl-prolyl cis-trans isomerase A (cyclophilin A)